VDGCLLLTLSVQNLSNMGIESPDSDKLIAALEKLVNVKPSKVVWFLEILID